MDELYRLIELKIRLAGYQGPIDGEEFYNDVCEQADEQDNGAYIFLIKKTDTLVYKGCVDVLDDDIDLHTVDIYDGEQCYHVDFDA